MARALSVQRIIIIILVKWIYWPEKIFLNNKPGEGKGNNDIDKNVEVAIMLSYRENSPAPESIPELKEEC